jgi:hypothetical protein
VKSITLAEMERLQAMLDGTYEPPASRHVHPEAAALHGGIAGVEIEPIEFNLAPGLMIRRTFAHVMAPYLLAFAPPPRPKAPHPAPWKAARGGVGFDVLAEIALATEARPTKFTRLNTLWWVLALIRLRTGAAARMPVVSDTPYAEVPRREEEPVLWPIEMAPAHLRLRPDPPTVLAVADLEWVRDHLISGAALMDDASFNRAMQTLDGVTWAHSSGAAIIITWAAIETLFRPGRQDVARKLATAVAIYLQPPGSERDRVFQRVRTLYEVRGDTAHASKPPQTEELFDSLSIARAAFCKAIEGRELPEPAVLARMWWEHRQV